MLLGIWKNIEDLEENLTLEELELVVNSSRKKEERHYRILASLKGIKLDDGEEEAETGEDALLRVKRRAAAKLQGKTDAEIDRAVDTMEMVEDFGLDIEVEE
jgi:hypothetical protein